MKKQIKLMSLFLSIMVSIFALSACGDDDNNKDEEEGGIKDRIVGIWVWGESTAFSPSAHHAARYIFRSNGKCEYEEHWNDSDYSSHTKKSGTFSINNIKLIMNWTSVTVDGKEQGTELDEADIMYPESGDTGMFLKRYYTVDGRTGWSEEGPFTKAK